MLIINCPGFFDRGMNIDEEDQCYVLVFEKGTEGSGNGEFKMPYDIELDIDGNIYISDAVNNNIQIFSNEGDFNTSIGDNDLKYPSGIALTTTGAVYVADMGNHRILRYDSLTATPTVISVSDGTAGNGVGEFNQPEGIDADSSQSYLIVADTGNRRLQLYNISSSEWQVISSSTAIGSFSKISDVVFDTKSPPNIYFVEKDKHRMIKLSHTGAAEWYDYEIAQTSDNEDFIIGKESGIGVAGSEKGSFNFPRGIANLSDKYIYVSDTLNNRIQKFDYDANIIEAWENDGYIDDEDSPGSDNIDYPVGIYVDDSENVYIIETNAYRYKKFKYRCGEGEEGDGEE